MSGGTTEGSHDRQWFIVERWQSYDGEARANVLRLLAVGLFYAVQMLQFFWFGDRGPAETALRKAIQIDPNYAKAHNNLAVIYVSQNPPLVQLARWHYQKALAAGHERNAELEKLLEKPAGADK